MLRKFDSLYICKVITPKTEKNGISAMPRSILRFLIWIVNLVFGPHAQTNWKPALFFQTSCGRLCIFGSLFRSYLSYKKMRPAFHFVVSLLVGAWSTSRRTITPKYVKMSGAWSIHLSGSGLAGPARRVPVTCAPAKKAPPRRRKP